MHMAQATLLYSREVLRIERLINLIAALLDAARPMTAEEIRERIAGYDQNNPESFRRAFERDKQDLRDIGIPIELVPTDPYSNVGEAYTIPKNRYYLPALDLAMDELAALNVAAQAVLGTGEAAESGFMKLSFDSPTTAWGGPRIVWGADVATENPLIPQLFVAVNERRPIGFDYQSGSGVRSSRVLEPYGLVHRRGHWYLVGRDRDRNEIRSFKVARMENLGQGNGAGTSSDAGSFDVPEDFDAESHLKEAWELGSESPQVATVRFDAEMRWWPEQNMPEATKNDGPDGSLDVEIPVANIEALISWVLGFGAAVEILSPPEARARLMDHLRPFVSEAGA